MSWQRITWIAVIVFLGSMLTISFPEPWESALAAAGATALGLWIWDLTGRKP